MNRSYRLSTVALTVLMSAVLLLAGCSKNEVAPDSRLSVFVSIPPYVTVVEAIGGSAVACQTMLDQVSSPATYEPNAKQLSELANASAYFSVGLPFEKSFLHTLERNFPRVRFVDLQVGIDRMELVGHSHAHDETTHEELVHLDPHTWLDPAIMIQQAEIICHELTALAPEDSALFAANLDSLRADLNDVDRYCAETLAPYAGRNIFVFHPSLGYFAQRYDLNQVAIERDGKAPSAKQLQELLSQMHSETVSALFVQPQFPSDEVTTLARELGVEVVVLDPMDRNYIINLHEIANQIAISYMNEDTVRR